MYQRLTLLSLFLSVFAFGASAQEKPATISSAAAAAIAKPSRDFLMLQLTYDGWVDASDSVKTTGFGRGFNAYINYDFPIKKSNFSFSAGIGIGTSNIYLKNQQVALTDTGSLGSRIRFVDETKDYKKYKLTTAYVEAPFELRYFANKENRNKGFKAAIGLRAGLLVGGKAKGNYSVEGDKVVEKVNTRRYLEKWRFSATARIGYGNFSLFGAYNLINVYKENAGPSVTQYSIGLAITGL